MPHSSEKILYNLSQNNLHSQAYLSARIHDVYYSDEDISTRKICTFLITDIHAYTNWSPAEKWKLLKYHRRLLLLRSAFITLDQLILPIKCHLSKNGGDLRFHFCNIWTVLYYGSTRWNVGMISLLHFPRFWIKNCSFTLVATQG